MVRAACLPAASITLRPARTQDVHGIRELVRSGTVALSRGPKTMAPAD